MKEIIDISWFEMTIGYLIILIPLFVFNYFKTGLIKDTLIAAARMTVQLLFVGLYMKYIFLFNNVFINLAWVLIMIVVASGNLLSRSKLNKFKFFVPIFLSNAISLFVVDIFVLKFVLKLDYLFEARYFIPISGMILGNCLKTNIIGITSYYKNLKKDKILYHFALANGADSREAKVPFIKDAMLTAFNPMIANMAVMGLISLPGMMTGQILGGANPEVAIKYQIIIMLTIFTSTILTVFLSILFSDRFVFDRFGNFNDKQVFASRKT